mgnify:FL=1
MIDPKGKKSYILLTDGLSQIWEVKTEKEAQRIATMMTENSDSGWVYKIRKSCERK